MTELESLRNKAKTIVNGSNFFLWPIAIILLIVNRFFPYEMLSIIVILLLVKFLISLLNLTNVSMKIFKFHYPEKKYPPQRRNILFINCAVILPMIGFSLYNTVYDKNIWITAFLMMVSFVLFYFMGFMVASRGERE